MPIGQAHDSAEPRRPPFLKSHIKRKHRGSPLGGGIAKYLAAARPVGDW